MSVAKAIYSKLTEAIAAVPVYAEDVAEGSGFPRIVYTINESDRPRTYAGSCGVTKSSVDVECQANSYTAAQTLGQSVVAALDNASGTWGGVVVQFSYFDNSTERHDEPLPGTANDVYTTALSFIVWTQD
jgi:hypothetical protein